MTHMPDNDIHPNAKEDERRRHPRRAVFKTARVYPVLRQIGWNVEDISRGGMSGLCAVSLSVRQAVHVSFNQRTWLGAEVRWVNGLRCGIMMDELLPLPDWEEPRALAERALQGRAVRLPVDLGATMAISGPMLAATVQNISSKGMMIAVGSRLAEGELLLVNVKGQSTFLGRVQWANGHQAGLYFEHGC